MFFDRKKTSAPVSGRNKTSGPRIVFSEDFKNVRLPEPEDNTHNVVTILRQNDIRDIWICPECECENTLLTRECRVCHFHL